MAPIHIVVSNSVQPDPLYAGGRRRQHAASYPRSMAITLMPFKLFMKLPWCTEFGVHVLRVLSSQGPCVGWPLQDPRHRSDNEGAIFSHSCLSQLFRSFTCAVENHLFRPRPARRRYPRAPVCRSPTSSSRQALLGAFLRLARSESSTPRRE